MNRVIVGFGNSLRGEDAFGIDVIQGLENVDLRNTKLMSTFQLTPELALDLIDFDEIIFVDASYSLINEYSIACSLIEQNSLSLTHHISVKMIISILNDLYNKYPDFQIYSMLSNSFDDVSDRDRYDKTVQKVLNFFIETS